MPQMSCRANTKTTLSSSAVIRQQYRYPSAECTHPPADRMFFSRSGQRAGSTMSTSASLQSKSLFVPSATTPPCYGITVAYRYLRYIHPSAGKCRRQDSGRS